MYAYIHTNAHSDSLCMYVYECIHKVHVLMDCMFALICEMRKHVHVRAYTYTYASANIYIHTYIYTCVHMYTCTLTCARALSRKHAHRHIHKQIHAYMKICPNWGIEAAIPANKLKF